MVKLIGGLLLCSFMISAPVYADASISSAPKAAVPSSTVPSKGPKLMSATQLKAFDGKMVIKAYVALNGKFMMLRILMNGRTVSIIKEWSQVLI